jgi:hypothetical protein
MPSTGGAPAPFEDPDVPGEHLVHPPFVDQLDLVHAFDFTVSGREGGLHDLDRNDRASHVVRQIVNRAEVPLASKRLADIQVGRAIDIAAGRGPRRSPSGVAGLLAPPAARRRR